MQRVYWHKRQKKCAAQITCNHKSHHLGYFTGEFTAARAYDKKAVELHGEFASLNLPEREKSGLEN